MNYYLLILMLIFIGIYLGIVNSKAYAPDKIKVIYFFIFFLLLLRSLLKVYMLFTPSVMHLYVFKYLYFIQLMCIPIGAIISIFIFLRSNSIKFNTILIGALIFFSVYTILIFTNTVDIKFLCPYGYIMNFIQVKEFNLFNIMFNLCLCLFSLYLITNKHCHRLGGFLIFISSLSSIAVVFNLPFVDIMITNGLTELLWIVTMNYSIYKLKK